MKIVALSMVFLTLMVESVSAQVGKWKRFEVSYANSTWGGNAFDMPLSGTFTSPTGRTFEHFGYYAGNDTWKINFMPDEVGDWTFTTTSTDGDLDGQVGSFNVVESGLPGPLRGVGNRWQLQDSGQYVAPIMLPSRQYFKKTETANGIDDFVDWAKNTAGARVIGTTLVYFNHEADASPYVKGQEGIEFNIPMWDRLQSHYDYLRDQGMGHYIMFYSDDSESPNAHNVTEGSVEEQRLLRYTIARFATYPTVMWDTGIDIGETRSNGWIDDFSDYFNDNDPWQHPVSSRTGGGSGGKFPDNGSYYSDGDGGDGNTGSPSRNTLINRWEGQSVPTAYTDRWRENGNRGNWDKDSLRKVAWRAGLTGGMAAYIGGAANGGYLTETYATDLEVAAALGYSATFFEEMILNFGLLDPHDELVTGDKAILSAELGVEYVVYDENGGAVTVDLSDANGPLSYYWYNPRTGVADAVQAVSGGGVENFNAPDTSDWVLHITAALQSGDIDGDNDIDGADFLKWQRDLGDSDSLALWEAGFGLPVTGASASTNVPEPSALALLVLSVAFAYAACPVCSPTRASLMTRTTTPINRVERATTTMPRRPTWCRTTTFPRPTAAIRPTSGVENPRQVVSPIR